MSRRRKTKDEIKQEGETLMKKLASTNNSERAFKWKKRSFLNKARRDGPGPRTITSDQH